MWNREDVVRRSPKRPPLAAGLRADDSGLVVVARTEGIVDAIASVAPHFEVREVDVVGPPTSATLRAAGWAEVMALLQPDTVVSPLGARASAEVLDDSVSVVVECGERSEEHTSELQSH